MDDFSQALVMLYSHYLVFNLPLEVSCLESIIIQFARFEQGLLCRPSSLTSQWLYTCNLIGITLIKVITVFHHYAHLLRQ
jgi:hypothetical protein